MHCETVKFTCLVISRPDCNIVTVVSMDPYSSALARIRLAYVDWGLLDVTCHDVIVVSYPSFLNFFIIIFYVEEINFTFPSSQ